MKTTWRFDRNRRRFLQQAGAAAALGPLLVSERTIAQTRTLYVNSWGGSYTAAQDAAFFKPFTAATGIQIRTVTPVSYGKIKAQVQTRTYEFDMTSINSMQWLRGSREGLAETIDWTHALLALGAATLDERTVDVTLGTVLKYREDQDRVRAHGLGTVVDHALRWSGGDPVRRFHPDADRQGPGGGRRRRADGPQASGRSRRR